MNHVVIATTGLSVKYKSNHTGATDPIASERTLVDDGAGSIALADLTLRYYFTDEGAGSAGIWWANDPSEISPTPWDHVTILRQGDVVWGTPP